MHSLTHFRVIAAFWLALASSLVMAQGLECEITVTKSPKWDNYDVIINMNAILGEQSQVTIATFALSRATPNSKSIDSVTKSFDCKTYQQFRFMSIYNPPIWRTTEGAPLANTFPSTKTWDISTALDSSQPQAGKFAITINFPDDFGAPGDPSFSLKANIPIIPKAR